MSFWKIAAGAAVGVGAIAAAPFTGGGSLLGAVTLAGSLAGGGTIAAATVAGVAGASAGYAMSDQDKKNKDEVRNKAREEVKEDIEKLKKRSQEMSSKLSEHEHYFKELVALAAVGFATANCDGKICDSEKLEILEFVAGVNASNMPQSEKNLIASFVESPPNIEQAFRLAKELENYAELKEDFEAVIDLVMHADGVTHTSEVKFKEEWRNLNAA